MLDGPSVVAALRECGITHIVWLPDSELGTWEAALTSDPELRLIRVCREGEAISVAGGLILGGARPIVLIQCTGLFEAGDALRNIVHDLKLPLFLLVGVRSYHALKEGKTADSCPVFTEPIMQAWQIPYVVLDRNHGPADLTAAYRHAQAENRAGGSLAGGVTAMLMTHQEALEVLARHRQGHVVITTMGSISIWPSLSDTPLDFAYIPSSMGQGPGLGLGLALAQPDRGVVVVNGDGCTLMNLGCLVTLAGQSVRLYLIIIDNGLYEVTGGQQTAGTGHANFAGLARAAGIHRVYSFADTASWDGGAAEALSGLGPVVICLGVEGRRGQKTPAAPRPMREQIGRLQQALCSK